MTYDSEGIIFVPNIPASGWWLAISKMTCIFVFVWGRILEHVQNDNGVYDFGATCIRV